MCAKRFGYSSFPQTEFFENILGKDTHRPMKSSDIENVVLLVLDRDKSSSSLFKDHNQEQLFINHIQKRFGRNDGIAAICNEYAKRLGLDGEQKSYR